MKRFPLITQSEYYEEVKARLLKHESVKSVFDEFGVKMDVSKAYLYRFRDHLFVQRHNKTDMILANLEKEGLIDSIDEVSFLRGVVAHATDHIKDATLAQGLDAAKILLAAKLHLSDSAADAIRNTLGKYFREDDKPIDTSGEATD